MKAMRMISAISAALLAAAAALLFVGMLIAIPDTLEHDKEIHRSFLSAHSWIDNYKLSKGRFPSQIELDEWSATQPKSFWLKSLELFDTVDRVPNEAIKTFGQAPNGGYVLGLWRGNWNEYFASWTKSSTIGGTNEVLLFVAEGGAVCGGLLVISFFLWSFGRPTRRSSGPQKAILLSSTEL